MLNIFIKSFFIALGVALLLPLSTPSMAEDVSQTPSGYYNFFSDWMSPRVTPIESRTIFVSEYAKRELPPREIETKVPAPVAVTQIANGYYNFYGDWMSPKVAPIQSRTLFVSEYAKRNIEPREPQSAKTVSNPVKNEPSGYYDFYGTWMSPRVEPMESKSLL